MAAGGSLVHYKVPAMLFTPVCPFSLSFRPLIFPEHMTIDFRIPEEARYTAIVGIDGHTKFELNRNEVLTVTVSKFPASCTLRVNRRLGEQPGGEPVGLVLQDPKHNELERPHAIL
eukprot:TRINITY_DN3275_c0_g1_i5.p4 TRINITY_DN3275_c0_g1~~TRINITY_DN3275_c0_g1_i5.p4  ORF type:complete len:116 (+),score=14.30 TRINITY_DN3275_c0_g1_i5:1063-1410(+)